jgi:hypothetical protein
MAYGWYDLIAHITGGLVTIMAFGFLGAVTGIILRTIRELLRPPGFRPGQAEGD